MDLTLDKRFGYTRRIPFHICEERSEETVVGEKEHTGSLCWEEVDWHLRKREEKRDTSKDEGIIVSLSRFEDQYSRFCFFPS